MRTEDLINALVADLTASRASFRLILVAGVVLGSIIAAVEFLFWIGVRPDIGHALETTRFLFKFVFTLCLAATAARLLSRLANSGRFDGLLGVGLVGRADAAHGRGRRRTHRHARDHVVVEARWNERAILLDADSISVDRPLGVHIGGLATGRADAARPHRRCRWTRGERHGGDALCVPLHR